ncbi:fibronectin type III domain-containing protein [Vallitalea guaymasensis]|uniref:fibronectin type III domain-containing protein n=1 Tax=Vallitalea guaymasensis TaxID=1185412 RepID=UPI000DE2A24C|nr:fibronectin type III domain-containing protein [Vallitalea guaymasensis]
MNKSKRLLSIIITFMFCITLMSNSAYADNLMNEQVNSKEELNINEDSITKNEEEIPYDTINDEVSPIEDPIIDDESTATPDDSIIDDKDKEESDTNDEISNTDDSHSNIDDSDINNDDSSNINEDTNIDDNNDSNADTDIIEDVEESIDESTDAKEEKLKKETKEKEKQIKNINEYLKNLDSKKLSKEIKKLTKDQLHSYLKEVKGYSDLQIEGKEPIINKNGNMFFYSDFRLTPYLPSLSESKKLKSASKDKGYNYDSVDGRYMLKSEIPNNMESQIDENLEVPFMRDENSKHYKMKDGSYTAVISPTPIHYLEDNKYKDINIIIKNNNSDIFEYSNLENSFKTYFNSSNSLDNNVISKYVKVNKNGSERQLEFMIENANPTHETLIENKIKYHNIFPNVDIEYQINPVRLKENIYVNEPVTEINYEFLLKVNGVIPKANDSLDIEFIDEDTDEIIWVMERPYAEDSSINQLITKDMHYDVQSVQVNGEDMIKLVLVMDDPTFLTDATYPIVIDPTIFPSMSNIRMVIEGNDEGFGYENGVHMCGFPHGSNDDEYRIYMNFNLSSMPSNSVIDVAQLTVFSQGELVNNNSTYYTCRRLTSSFNNATWYNKPTVSRTNEVRMPSKPADAKLFRIENLMNDAIRAGQFYGVEITGERSSGAGFYTYVDQQPQLFVSYRVNTVPEIYFCNLQDYYVIKKGTTGYAVQIGIRDDSPSNQLTTDLYVNGVKKHTKTGMAPVFVVDYTQVPDGICTLKFVVSDGMYTAERTVPIKVDRHSPTINDVQVNSAETSINVSVSATDPAYSLPSAPYGFGIDGNMNSYSSNNNTTFTGLQPSSTHTINIKVQDISNQVTEDSRVITTKAQVPTLTATDIKSNEMTINMYDNNDLSAEYLIQFDSKYVSSNGTLITSPEWITLDSNKCINITSLDIGKSYSIKAKARNKDHIETNYSSTITISTIGEVPAVVQNLAFNVQENNIVFNWNAITDATKYDIEINDNITQVTENQYILENAQLDLNYKVRVRGVNSNGNGEWCDFLEFTPSENVAFQTVNGEEYYLTCNAIEKTSLHNNNFILIYNPEDFELVDLCAATYEKEKTVGKINGSISPITVDQVEPGRIQFSIDRENYDNQLYSSPFNTVVLKALKSQESVVQFKTPVISTTP